MNKSVNPLALPEALHFLLPSSQNLIQSYLSIAKSSQTVYNNNKRASRDNPASQDNPTSQDDTASWNGQQPAPKSIREPKRLPKTRRFVMKYKVLLMGNNKSTIDDLFLRTSDVFECQSTSNRFDDIASHLKHFLPHIVIYCMSNETRETMSQLITIKRDKVQRRTPFAIVATQEDCDEFRKMSADTADLELVKPITALQIADRVINYLRRNFSFSEEDPKPAPVSTIIRSAEDEKKQAILNNIDSLFADSKSDGRKHILVVDDDFRMLKLIKRYLEDRYDVATAINGGVALKFLRNKMTDLILLDYEMPDENGPAVLEKLRDNPLTSDIPVVFLTGINDRKKIQQVLALKPQGYLLKPIDHDKLLDAIKTIIG